MLRYLLLGLNILLSALNLGRYFRVTDQASHRYKTTGITVMEHPVLKMIGQRDTKLQISMVSSDFTSMVSRYKMRYTSGLNQMIQPYPPFDFTLFCFTVCYNRDSSGSIKIRLLLGRQGFNSWQKQGLFLFSIPALGATQPPTQWVLGGLFPRGLMRLEREADHSPPSSAEVKNAWSYISTPPICLQDVVLN
jgi:hypothetical protein